MDPEMSDPNTPRTKKKKKKVKTLNGLTVWLQNRSIALSMRT